MKRFWILFFILFAVSVFIPIGYGQFQPEGPPEDPPGVPDRSFLNVTIKVPSNVQKGAFNARIRFAEEVADFVQSDVILTGTATASITGWSSTDDVIFNATITPVTSGTVIIGVPADVATDVTGAQNNAATPQTVRIDVDAPSVSITVPSVAQSGAFDVTITFTEAVSGFEQADLSVSGTASITGWTTTDDTVFTATITPTTEGDVVLSVAADVATDAASNNNMASETQTVTVDMTPPGVSLSVPADAQNSAFEATITFTEAVSDFEQADLTLSGTATATVTAWASTDDTVFTATLTPTTEGEVVLSVMADVAADTAGNNNTASETQTVTVDMTPPGVSLSVPEGAQNGAFDVTITFTEAVSGFEQADLSVSGTATTSITAWTTTDNTVFTATITPTTSGTVILDIAAEVATDAANNNNTASETQTVTIDVDAPGVSISVPTDAQNSAFDVTITFTEAVSDFEQSDLTLSGTATASITAWTTTDNTVWTATLTPTTSGTLTLSIAEGAVTDTAGNTNVLSTAEVNITLNVADACVSVCDRTSQVRNAIVAALPNVSDCADVTAADLATIRYLNIRNQNITALKAGDFNGLTALTHLWLSNNELSSLPADIFDDLTALTHLYLVNSGLSSLPAGIFDKNTALERLYVVDNELSSLPAGIFDKNTALELLHLNSNELSSLPVGIFDDLIALKELYLYGNELSSLPAGIFDNLIALQRLYLYSNTVDPLSLTVSLKQIEAGQFKVTVPTGAPFNVSLTLRVTNGSIDEEATAPLTISRGRVESETLTVSRAPGTTDAVLVDIETLPPIPGGHSGYELVKSADLPLTVIDALGNAAPRRIPVDAVPSETVLSANYPNPFNPETWIPYQLSNTSDVKITIYDMRGTVVRRLDLGHQRAGYYTRRSRAAYWNGRNTIGEKVSSGVYFYQLQTDNISLLRKMHILK